MLMAKPAARNVAVEFDVTAQMRRRAAARAAKLGVLRNSITNGESNYWGMLGEELVATVLGARLVDTPDYDVLTPGNVKVEVKSKKTGDVAAPKWFFECSVCEHNVRQRCDAYLFVRLSTRANKAWVCGWLPRAKFFKEARYFKAGDTDARNNYRVHASCYNVNVSQLCAPELLLKT